MEMYGDMDDRKSFFKGMFAIASVFAFMYASRGMFAAAFPLIAVVVLSRKRRDFLLLFSFILVAVFNGNSNIVKISTIPALAIRLAFAFIAFAMACRMAAGLSNRCVSPLLGVMPYVVWESAISAFGWCPIISYLKLALFCMMFFALYGTACSAAAADVVSAARQRSYILSGVAFFVFGSVLLIPIPSIGMMRPDELIDAAMYGRNVVALFKGMTNHSQALGPMVAVFVTLTFCDMLFTVGKWRLLHVMIVVSGFILVYKTSSRTAMGSLLAGMGMSTWLFMRARGVGQRRKGKIVSVMSMIALLFACTVLCVPSVQDKVARFILKFDTDATLEDISFEGVTVTRQSAVDFAMYNFRKKPLTGNGFQVSEDMAYTTRRSFKEYLSAPVEKGVWVSAVLEEGGVVGFVLFAGFLLVAFLTFVSRKAYAAASVLFTMAVENLGEFTVFSMTGAGGVVWLCVFCATVLDAHRNKARAWNLRPWPALGGFA